MLRFVVPIGTMSAIILKLSNVKNKKDRFGYPSVTPLLKDGITRGEGNEERPKTKKAYKNTHIYIYTIYFGGCRVLKRLCHQNQYVWIQLDDGWAWIYV